jgi:hypothetical protein
VPRPLWPTEAFVRAAVGDAVLEGVCVEVGLVMRYVLWDLEVEACLTKEG